ncbi:MAG: class I SAM-dependent methyltransferase [Gammaproteobacteria bacterium]|nr:class I SAM-dependent methyltransferase [Gammaproteobacteria bacterium]MDH5800147.1 class I SAM-dependent methyltransferase [Gammaproteobacteria bacterium]
MTDTPDLAAVELFITEEALEPQAQVLAKEWQLSYGGCQAEHSGIPALWLVADADTDYRLELSHSIQDAKPLWVNFNSGRTAYRVKHGGGRHQAIAKAIGIKADLKPHVIDATAGLGRDGFILAKLGCRVDYVERSAITALLLQDGLRRALMEADLSWVQQRITLHCRDSIAYLREHSADVVYMDPMYPEKTKSALVKKEMRILRTLVGKDTDSAELLNVALTRARKRVVVKRPKGAAPITAAPFRPSHCIETKSTRYDVYMIHADNNRHKP